MVNAQEWLESQEEYNTKEKREKITELNISGWDWDKEEEDSDWDKLEGNLDLSDFINLERLWCNNNQLTSLCFSNCQKLKTFNCGFNKLTNLDLTSLGELETIELNDNYLTSFDYSVLNPAKLTYLNVIDNNLSNQDCTVFSKFVNLETLMISNSNKEHHQQNVYNKFHGSLEPLKNLTKLKSLYISNTDIDDGLEFLPKGVEEIYCSSQERSGSKVKKIEEQLKSNIFFDSDNARYKRNWKDIHLDFTPELQEEWENGGFNYEECKEWIGIGMRPTNADYCAWLKVLKKKEAKWVSNNGGSKEELNNEYQEFLKEVEKGYKFSALDIGLLKNLDCSRNCHGDLDLTSEQELLLDKLIPTKELSEKYKKYGLCLECNQPNTGKGKVGDYKSKGWCQPCNSKHFQQEFNNWTSGNVIVDELIKKTQLEATNDSKILEWISYEQFTDVEYLAEGGFGKVYKAKWADGPIKKWSIKNNNWKRFNSELVALKILNNSQEIKSDFLQEIANHELSTAVYGDGIIKCHGLSQDPETKNYIMVMEYKEGGNLRHFLSENWNQLSFRDKLNQLRFVAQGLRNIHNKGLVHRDLHSGNILSDGKIRYPQCWITDLGLSRPANEKDDGKIYGVLPYVAPEVLLRSPYTQAADIYSFGIISFEVLTSLPIYHDIPHDAYLALKVCEGLRPDLGKLVAPRLLKDLISNCWDADPLKRPTADEIAKKLYSWLGVTGYFEGEVIDEKSEFYLQYQESEIFNQNLPEEIRFMQHEIHPQVSYCSKLINTKQITQLLQQKTIEKYHTKALDELVFDNFNLDELNIQEDPQEQSSTQAQVEIPPKGNN